MKERHIIFIEWDWKGTIDFDRANAYLQQILFLNKGLQLFGIDTQSDSYAMAICTNEFTEQTAQQFYNEEN